MNKADSKGGAATGFAQRADTCRGAETYGRCSSFGTMKRFAEQLVFATGKLGGTRKKLMNFDKLKQMGWMPEVGLKEGIQLTYQDYIKRECK